MSEYLNLASSPVEPGDEYIQAAIIAQKAKLLVMDFFSKCDQIRRKLQFGHIY